MNDNEFYFKIEMAGAEHQLKKAKEKFDRVFDKTLRSSIERNEAVEKLINSLK